MKCACYFRSTVLCVLALCGLGLTHCFGQEDHCGETWHCQVNEAYQLKVVYDGNGRYCYGVLFLEGVNGAGPDEEPNAPILKVDSYWHNISDTWTAKFGMLDTENTIGCVLIDNDGTGPGLKIQQSAGGDGINVEMSGGEGIGVNVSTGTGNQNAIRAWSANSTNATIFAQNASASTSSGYSAYFKRTNGACPVVMIENTSTSAGSDGMNVISSGSSSIAILGESSANNSYAVVGHANGANAFAGRFPGS